jgi:chromate reductase
MILTSPEYNWLPPATIKNAVDWLSRMQPMPLDKKSILLSSATPSLVGGVRGLMSLRTAYEALGTWVYPKMFTLAQAPGAFNDDGTLKSEDLSNMLTAMVADYCSAAAALNNR